jgi:CRISPR/Cas system CMR-associated protein Cmr5 small subunit
MTMKKKDKMYNSELPPIIISDRLAKYDKMPLFQKKLDKVNAILAKSSPFEAFKAIENDDIKAFFMKGKSIEQIAVLMQLSEEEIGIRLKDLGLLEKVGV